MVAGAVLLLVPPWRVARSFEGSRDASCTSFDVQKDDSDFIYQLIDRADRKLFKLIQRSHHCLNPLPPSSRLPHSRYSLCL